MSSSSMPFIRHPDGRANVPRCLRRLVRQRQTAVSKGMVYPDRGLPAAPTGVHWRPAGWHWGSCWPATGYPAFFQAQTGRMLCSWTHPLRHQTATATRPTHTPFPIASQRPSPSQFRRSAHQPISPPTHHSLNRASSRAASGSFSVSFSQRSAGFSRSCKN